MERELLSGLENFGEVWRRVRGESAPTPAKTGDGAAVMLRGHMDRTAAAASHLTALAGRCGAAFRGELLRLAQAENRRFRCLQLEYFLLTGACHSPAGSCPCRGSLAQGLRGAYLAAQEAEAALRADAPAYADELREALLAAAEGEAKSARALRKLLKTCFIG